MNLVEFEVLTPNIDKPLAVILGLDVSGSVERSRAEGSAAGSYLGSIRRIQRCAHSLVPARRGMTASCRVVLAYGDSAR